MKLLRQLNKHAERYALLFFYSVLVASMALEVLRREILSFSSVWGEEVVRYSFIYLVWIGAAAAVKERAHIRIDVLYKFVTPRVRTLLYIFADLIMVAMAIMALIWAIEPVTRSIDRGSVLEALQISRAWALTAVPLGFTLVIIRLFQSIYNDLVGLVNGTPVFEGNKLFD